MKTWIKRSLIGLAAAATLFGGLAAYAHQNGCGHGWHAMSTEDVARHKARFVERVAGKMELDATQKAKLSTLADTVLAQRQALRGSGADPRAQVQALFAGNGFDRAGANQLAQAKLAAAQAGAPQLINALGDFYDSLQPAQQAKLREFMASRGRHGGHAELPAGFQPGSPGG